LRDLIEFGQRRGLMRETVDSASAAFLIHHAIDMAATQLLVREVSDPAPSRLEFRGQVEEALRNLTNPAALTQCELIRNVPATLCAVATHLGGPKSAGEAAPLEQAQALREVLVTSVDRLKPPRETVGPAAERGLIQ
ncbi:MAG: hypothetical protein ACE5Q6_16740, partial [Dehalococcoidia bacterium]